ncbi:MAG: bifunctional precorrin-2 dehydrogenase/sirohydrochlorin ferrochelatase [Anaerolineales bacterium]|nr:bifunctional precorrin-2 dehydrogenase/sirohydrochlorin ferrochelatase [Anaerolineales bacterium]
MKTYTICLVGLDQYRSVVIGGGKVAARKAETLLEAGAQVTAISPQFCSPFQALADLYPSMKMVCRQYQNGDLADAFLVIAATNETAINQTVWEEAVQRGCLINVVDDPQHSNFILPALARRGEVTLAVSTGGASPALARRLRERLESLIGAEYGDLAAILAELRPELKARFNSGAARLEAALRLVDSDLLEVILSQGKEAAREHALELLAAQAETED